MTIDKVKLTELLVEKTGLEKEKVEEQLLQLISRVQQAAEQGKSFRIEGFGTFSVRNDILHFEPGDTLEMEINHKYAGMKPIELVGAFEEMPPVEEEEDQDEVTADQPGETERSMEEILGIGTGAGSPFAGSEPAPVADTDEESTEEKELRTSFVFDAETALEDDKNSEKKEPAVDTASKKSGRQGKDPIGTVLTICVVILTIGVAGWVVYDFGMLSVSESTTQTVVQATPDQPERPGNVSPDDPSPGSGVSTEPDVTEQQSVNVVSGGKQENNTPAVSPVYGLTGTISPEANNGYTVVVYSLGSRESAQSRQAKLSSDGYRVVITSAEIDGQTYWRVGLGQFETIADAQEAADLLPEPYRSNYFIKRIQ